VVIANRVTKERFWEDSVVGPNPLKDPISFTRRTDPKGEVLVVDYKAKEPEIVFDGSLSLFMDGVTIDAFVVPGHTEAETAVFVREEGVLFTSDNVFNGVMTWYHESLPFEWLKSLERLSRMPVNVIVPGHGKPGGPELLDAMYEVVYSAMHEVEIAIESGMNRDEAIENVSFSDWSLVSAGHKHVAERMQKIFVGRIFDQVAAQR
jgi:glyoxylase-like metal-dependent hydrolase (beta-lactamase superfamily II)